MSSLWKRDSTKEVKKIAVFTTSRADYGLLRPLIKELGNNCLVFAGGGHFGTGMVECTESFDFFLSGDSSYSISRSLGIEQHQLAEIFNDYDFDMVCVLGDRYELLPIATTSTLFGLPIVHIHGGEVTEGAIDNKVRNMLSQVADFHFTSCEEHKKNVEALGKKNVYNVGTLAVDAIQQAEKIPRDILFKRLRLDTERDTILLVYHPTMLEKWGLDELLNVLSWFDFQIVSLSPAMEVGRNEVEKLLRNYHYFGSLGSDEYYSLLRECKFILGNSSSGIVEAPFFGVPTVNIGTRQKGRVRHRSVIDTDYFPVSITKAINLAMGKEFRGMKYKFGTGNTAKKIVEVLRREE